MGYEDNCLKDPDNLIQQWMNVKVSTVLHNLWRESGHDSALDSAHKYVMERVYRYGERSLALVLFWISLATSIVLLVVAMNWYSWFYSGSAIAGAGAIFLLLEYQYKRKVRAYEQRKYDEAMSFIKLHDHFVVVTRNRSTKSFEKRTLEELKSDAKSTLVSAALTVLKIEAVNNANNIPRVHWDAEHEKAADGFKELYALMHALRLAENSGKVDYGPYYSAAQALLDKSRVT